MENENAIFNSPESFAEFLFGINETPDSVSNYSDNAELNRAAREILIEKYDSLNNVISKANAEKLTETLSNITPNRARKYRLGDYITDAPDSIRDYPVYSPDSRSPVSYYFFYNGEYYAGIIETDSFDSLIQYSERFRSFPDISAYLIGEYVVSENVGKPIYEIAFKARFLGGPDAEREARNYYPIYNS